jgi:hypothetical protein
VCDAGGGEGAAPHALAGDALAHSGSASFFLGALVVSANVSVTATSCEGRATS